FWHPALGCRVCSTRVDGLPVWQSTQPPRGRRTGTGFAMSQQPPPSGRSRRLAMYEIEILVALDAAGLLVVEKETNQTWETEDLVRARQERRFRSDDRFRASDTPADVSGPFPGCLQRGGGGAEYSEATLLGHTRHFLIFAPPG